MSATDIIAIITVGTVAVIVVMMALVRMAEGRSGEDSETATDLTSVNAEVAKLRAEVQDLRRARRPSSTFMDMADALNRLSNPPPTYDEASLEVPLMDLALGKVVQVRLLNDKDVEFRLPAKTKSGTRFRFRRGGEEGRDLHLTVRATPETSNGS